MARAPQGVAPEVVAAGAVVLRKGKVLLVHRPKYDDWSFPKGKVDRGEPVAAAAVREVGEETGLRVKLGVPLNSQSYPLGRRTKRVHYWIGRVVGDPDVSGYRLNAEIDRVAWVPLAKAASRLTYDYDRDTLAEAVSQGKKTEAVIILRHAKARARKAWKRDDTLRPLLALGRRQADKAARVIDAYDPAHLITSPSVRCAETLQPYADHAGWAVIEEPRVSEEGATAKRVSKVVDGLLALDGGAVVCSHRPVLPAIFDALGVPEQSLEPGALVVVHHRRGRVRAVESWSPTPTKAAPLPAERAS